MASAFQIDHKRDSLGDAQPHNAHAALLTIEEVAAMLSVPVSWVYERTRRRTVNRIPGFRLGKYWRFREADIFAWIERQRVGAPPHA